MKKFKSFTKYVEARREESPTFEIFGETFQLPPSLPYDAILRFQALTDRDSTEELTVDDIVSIFESVVGKQNVEALRKYDEFDVDIMTQIMAYAFEVYGVSKEQTEESEEKTPKSNRARK